MLGNLRAMLREKFFLVAGLLISCVDFPRFGILDGSDFRIGTAGADTGKGTAKTGTVTQKCRPHENILNP